MRLWLTRQSDGQFMLTKRRPTIDRILGTNKRDVYCVPGEPIGVRHLCRNGVIMMAGGNERVQQMEPLDSIEIHLSAIVSN